MKTILPQIFWMIIAIIAFYIDYQRKEHEHKKIIENLKLGVYTESTQALVPFINVLLTLFIFLLFVGFFLYVVIFIRLKIYPLYFIAPVGIGISLILLVLRDFKKYRNQRRDK